MPLPTSGPLSIEQIAAEFGGTVPHSLSEYYRGGGLVRNSAANANIPTSGAISIQNFYGAAAGPVIAEVTVPGSSFNGSVSNNAEYIILSSNDTIYIFQLSSSGLVQQFAAQSGSRVNVGVTADGLLAHAAPGGAFFGNQNSIFSEVIYSRSGSSWNTTIVPKTSPRVVFNEQTNAVISDNRNVLVVSGRLDSTGVAGTPSTFGPFYFYTLSGPNATLVTRLVGDPVQVGDELEDLLPGAPVCSADGSVVVIPFNYIDLFDAGQNQVVYFNVYRRQTPTSGGWSQTQRVQLAVHSGSVIGDFTRVICKVSSSGNTISVLLESRNQLNTCEVRKYVWNGSSFVLNNTVSLRAIYAPTPPNIPVFSFSSDGRKFIFRLISGANTIFYEYTSANESSVYVQSRVVTVEGIHEFVYLPPNSESNRVVTTTSFANPTRVLTSVLEL